MSKKPMVCLFFLFFSMEMVFCAEEPLPKRRKKEKKQSLRPNELKRKREPDETTEVKRPRREDLGSLSQEQKNIMLWREATTDKNVNKIEIILGANANLECQDENGNTLLSHLVGDPYGELFKGSPLYNKKNHENELGSNVKMIKVLLRARANPDSRDKNDNTPLHVTTRDLYAERFNGKLSYNEEFHLKCLRSRLNVMKALFEFNANPNLKDKNDKTPLFGESIDAYSLSCSKAFHFNQTFRRKCLENKFLGMQLLLEEQADVNVSDVYGNRSLHEVVRVGYRSIVNLLLEKGADPNLKNQRGVTPMHIAAYDKRSFPTVLIQLLLHGGDIHETTPLGDTVVSLAQKIHSRAALVIKDMIKSEIDKNHLFLACLVSHFVYVEQLIAQNGDVNQRDKRGRTLLMYAVCDPRRPVNILRQQDAAKVAKLLLAANADVNVKLENGATALSIAMANSNEVAGKVIRKSILAKKRAEIIEYLEEEGWPKLTVELILELAGTYESHEFII